MSDLTADQYQGLASGTAIYGDACGVVSGGSPGEGAVRLAYVALGLAGESGEVANKVKKIIRDRDGVVCAEDVYSLAKELGDVSWYLAMVCSELGLSLGDVFAGNLRKLGARERSGSLGGDGDDR